MIGDRVFEGNQLTSVEIPEGVTIIGEGSFTENQLISIVIRGVTEIGRRIRGNKLTSVEIPVGVQ